MKKNNQNGFVLAETLIVSIFLLTLFTLIYSNFVPLIGEYEKRETYDDVDGKYAAFWIKKLIESDAYMINSTKNNSLRNMMQDKGFARFECGDLLPDSPQYPMCKNLVKDLEIAGCDLYGNMCEIYITNYRLDGITPSFKHFALEEELTKSSGYSADSTSPNSCKLKTSYLEYCRCEYTGSGYSDDSINKLCGSNDDKLFSSAFTDYIQAIPDFITPSLNYANYRVIVMFRHKKDGNNFYSFSTIEVAK